MMESSLEQTVSETLLKPPIIILHTMRVAGRGWVTGPSLRAPMGTYGAATAVHTH